MAAIEEAVVEKLRSLPTDKQREVLDFVEFLQRRAGPTHPRRSLRGLWADLRVDISDEDIAEVRREAWGCFASEEI